ncbi:MAG: hypothetical protein ABL872_13850 [Lacibacter sp.]
MERYITQESKTDLLKLGVYQIIGGAIGILLLIWLIIKTETFPFGTIVIIGIMTFLFIFSIIAGLSCTSLNEKCIQFSTINQLLQSFGFIFLGFGYQFASGIYLTIGVDLTESFKFDFGFGLSKVILNFNTQDEIAEFHINVIAIGICFWIWKLQKRIKEEMSIRKLPELEFDKITKP